MIRIAVSESAPLFKNSLIRLLNSGNPVNPKYKIVLDTASNEELIEGLLQMSTVPDIVTVDLNIRNINGIAIISELCKLFPTMPIIVFSDLSHKNAVLNILNAGAASYLSKYADSEYILETIENVYCHNNMPTGIGTNLPNLKRSSKFNQVGRYILSNREIAFLKLCSSELTYKEIADKMNVSFSTVCNYREALFDKLSIRSRVGLVLFSINALLFNPFSDL